MLEQPLVVLMGFSATAPAVHGGRIRCFDGFKVINYMRFGGVTD